MSSDFLTPALFEYIDHGAYPESEDVASAELPYNILVNLQSDLRNAQEEAKNGIRALSRRTAPDVDTWIARAKEVQADILRSRETARQIVAEAEIGKDLRAKIQDGGNKISLLEKELAFNETLTATLEHIRYANGVLDKAQDDAVRGRVARALETLEDAESSTAALGGAESSRPYGLLRSRAEHLKKGLTEMATQYWSTLITIDPEAKRMTVRERDSRLPEVDLQEVVIVTTGLGIFNGLVSKLSRDIDRAILKPRMTVSYHAGMAKLVTSHNELTCISSSEEVSHEALFTDLQQMVGYLSTRLPTSVAVPLASSLLPSLATRLEEAWLEPSVPLDVSEMGTFQALLNHVLAFAEQIDSVGWHDAKALRDWVQSAPRTWLMKRREAVLGDVRNLVFTGLREQKVVERVETQMVRKDDALVANGHRADDDWDNAWDEPEEQMTVASQTSTASQTPQPAEQKAEGDDDASAWDIDDDDPMAEKQEGGEEDAWGWGDEEASQQPRSPVTARKEPPKPNGNGSQGKASEREITLRETYTVTAVPEGILHIIQQTISDAETLAGPDFSSSPIAPAATGLYSLPTLALAIYRATATIAYTNLDTGNMLIYNDASRLSEQLRAWQASQPPSSRLRLDNDAKSLDQFAKRAYSSEMDSQRTILHDFLNGAQGFVHCTETPFKAECEGAVEQTVDRLREVYRQWKDVLPQSALLQSLGSLLSTVTSKMISEIEDLGDISEPESKQLKILLDGVTEIKDLFTQRSGTGQEGDMTFIYCPNWLKLQYLAEILESSLADIKYLWKEGELSLEFDAEEVVELIEALFAESDLRRRAIAEIRRGGRG